MDYDVDFSFDLALAFASICSLGATLHGGLLGHFGVRGDFRQSQSMLGCHRQSSQTVAKEWNCWFAMLLLTAEILHQLIGSLSHYLQGFIHPRWLTGFLPSNSRNANLSALWIQPFEVFGDMTSTKC